MILRTKFNTPITMNQMSSAYACYKQLYGFYMDHQKMVGETELRSRLKHILKYKPRQRTEVETILWILGEKDIASATKE